MKFLNYLTASLLFIVVFVFYRFVHQNAVNVPYFDDYAYLEYMLKLIQAPHAWEFLRELEYKHNGHGVITAKLVFWVDYWLTGQVNYRTLILTGSGLVLALFGYFWKVLSVNKLPLFFLLPVALFLFTPAYHENIFWAAALWQYTASFGIGIVTYYLLAKPTRGAFVGAMIAGFFLTYTNGNGLFGMYIGILIPLLQMRYRTAVIWLVACIVTTTLFYWYYPFGFGSLGQEKSLKNSLLTIVSFFGASASYLRGRLPEVAILGGTITLLLLGLTIGTGLSYLQGLKLWPKKFAFVGRPFLLDFFTKNQANVSLFALLAWLLVTGLGVATARAGQALETPARYMIYSVMAVVALYVAFLMLLPKRLQWLLAVGMTLLGSIFSLGTYLFAGPDVINFRNSLLADAFSLQQHRRVSGKLETMSNLLTKKYFDEAVEKGMYVFPSTPIPSNLLAAFDASKVMNIPWAFEVDTLPAYGGILINKIRNEQLTFDQTQSENALFLLLKNDSTTYLTAVRQAPNRDRKAFLQTGQFFKGGFEAWVFQDNVPAGRYHLGVLFCEGDRRRVIYTPQQLTIQDFRK